MPLTDCTNLINNLNVVENNLTPKAKLAAQLYTKNQQPMQHSMEEIKLAVRVKLYRF